MSARGRFYEVADCRDQRKGFGVTKKYAVPFFVYKALDLVGDIRNPEAQIDGLFYIAKQLALDIADTRMARAHTILQSEYPYIIGARSINKDWFSIPMDTVWAIMSEQLFFIHHAFNVKIHAFILMSNHFHLLMSTPEANLNLAMQWFMRETSRSLVRAGNRINQSYGGPYFRTVIGTHHYYLNAYKYLYYNPVEAGICQDVIEYPYSTLHGLLGFRHMFIPVEEDTTLFRDFDGTLRWLNAAPSEANWEAVRKAVRRCKFELPRDNGRVHALEIDTL